MTRTMQSNLRSVLRSNSWFFLVSPEQRKVDRCPPGLHDLLELQNAEHRQHFAVKSASPAIMQSPLSDTALA